METRHAPITGIYTERHRHRFYLVPESPTCYSVRARVRHAVPGALVRDGDDVKIGEVSIVADEQWGWVRRTGTRTAVSVNTYRHHIDAFHALVESRGTKSWSEHHR